MIEIELGSLGDGCLMWFIGLLMVIVGDSC